MSGIPPLPKVCSMIGAVHEKVVNILSLSPRTWLQAGQNILNNQIFWEKSFKHPESIKQRKTM